MTGAPSAKQQGKPAIFLDRDGTLNREVHYLADPDRFEWLPGSLEAVGALARAGYLLIVVTNQSGIAQGLLDEDTLQAIHARMADDLLEIGVTLDGIYHCPHHPRLGESPWVGPCDCRKPAPGLLRQAIAEHSIDLQGSWMIGDSLRDVEAGRALGLPGILVRTGKGSEQEPEWPAAWNDNCSIADDLAAAVQIILAQTP